MRRPMPRQNRPANRLSGRPMPAGGQRQGMAPQPAPRQAMAAQAGGRAAMPNPPQPARRRMAANPAPRPMNRGARQEVAMQDSKRRPAPAPRRPMN